MRVLIDGDAFPDIESIINVCKKYNRKVIIYIDTSHVIENNYAEVVTTMIGDNASDILLENEVSKNDLVLTQDYGVAVIALSKGAFAINQYGRFYTDDNISYLMEAKNTNRKLRKHTNIKGPKKRSDKDKKRLIESITSVISADF